MGNTLAFAKTLVRGRELYVRDGETVRRLGVPAWAQLTIFALFLALVGWSSFATARFITAQQAVVSYEEEVNRHQLLEQRQKALAAMATTLADEKFSAAVEQLEELGVDAQALGTGGPYQPVTEGDATFKQLFQSWKKLDNLSDGAIAVPSEKPVKSAVLTSGYGTRNDPFKGRRARHGGLDLAGPIGTPIYATADGVVLRAGWNSGGYGNLVEIDHGRGIVTRYAHMSNIAVKAGDRIARGTQVGKMGSTGRSTGSHLHYEVRIDGKAVNPIPFMKSTDYLVAMKESNESMEELGLGGGDR
ncbi:M23 family metallopeptidase [Sphingomicrobium nitratireducens]|uniref:M23 family metallopeptidase n=1 Tax=Sphingomicrobium nitratireducens TaxID=2964666 RepID=UPI00223F21A6|nr:M23 family metallopeptidase [Sphingomicrobium nitratireducens]